MNVQLLLVPYDSGHRGRRCGAGPEHLLRAGLQRHLERHGHVVTRVQVLEDDPAKRPAQIRTAFELARRLAPAVRSARAAGDFPLVLSGNCNAATVPGFEPVLPRMTFLLGVRDLDPAEASWLRQSEITSVPVEQVSGGLPMLMERAPLADALGYLHLDLDVLDPTVGRANYLPVPHGLSLEQLTGAMAAVRRRVPLAAATVASYSPEEDRDQGICRAAFAAIAAMLT